MIFIISNLLREILISLQELWSTIQS